MNAHELKSLQVRLTKAKAKAESARAQLAEMNREYQRLTDQVAAIEAQIKEAEESAKEPIVSEHAIVRYIERVLGHDLEQIKADILDQQTIASVKALGNGTYPRGDFKVKVKNKVVVTVI